MIKLKFEDYLKINAVSSSTLKLFNDDPAAIQWEKNCPVDKEKLKTLDFGSAVHGKLLEPEEFKKEFATLPDLPRNTKAGKEAHAEFIKNNSDKIHLTNLEAKKVDLMAGSALAHPVFQRLYENRIYTEASLTVYDNDNDLTLKSRYDMLSNIDENIIVTDIKTIDDIKNVQRNIHDFLYHLQEAFYNHVYFLKYGVYPAAFVFVFISKKVSLGRYPVAVVELDAETKEIGLATLEDSLFRYGLYVKNDRFPGIKNLGLPAWAKNKPLAERAV